MKKYIAPLILCSLPVYAQDFQTFIDAEHKQNAIGGSDYSSDEISISHYFAPQNSSGPWDEFAYIDTDSKAFGHFWQDENNDVFGFGGEYINGPYLIGGRYQDEDLGGDYHEVNLGYFVEPHWLVKANLQNLGGDDDAVYISSSYDHSLGGIDYLGVTVTVDDALDNYEISGKYFLDLGEDRYLAVDAVVNDFGGQYWQLGAKYYLTKASSGYFAYDKNKQYTLEAQHFISEGLAVKASYSSNLDDSSNRLYGVGIRYQF